MRKPSTKRFHIIKYSWLSLFRPRLSRITAYLEMKILSLLKHENLTTGKNILWKRGEIVPKEQFLLFPQYFQYTSISYFKSPITYIFVKCCCSNNFFLNSANWYVEVRMSRSISESRFEFEITRVEVTWVLHVNTATLRGLTCFILWLI